MQKLYQVDFTIRFSQEEPIYIKLLDFADFAVQAANSRIGPFASRVLNLSQ